MIHLAEVDLMCPKCGAANRPGATIIEFRNGVAVCGVCGKDWKPKE